jgi:hypothetical protein
MRRNGIHDQHGGLRDTQQINRREAPWKRMCWGRFRGGFGEVPPTATSPGGDVAVGRTSPTDTPPAHTSPALTWVFWASYNMTLTKKSEQHTTSARNVCTNTRNERSTIATPAPRTHKYKHVVSSMHGGLRDTQQSNRREASVCNVMRLW